MRKVPGPVHFLTAVVTAFLFAVGLSAFAQLGPADAPFPINDTAGLGSSLAAVSRLVDGGFVVVWMETETGSDEDIAGRRFATDGTPIGSEFRVNTETPYRQSDPAVAATPAGGFVVTWQSTVSDGSLQGVVARRYDDAGLPIGNEFSVNTYTSGSQLAPRIGSTPDGGFVISWGSGTTTSPGPDGSGSGIAARRFGADGVALGNEFPVNAYTSGNQFTSDLAVATDGSFVIVWNDGNFPSPDGNGAGVFGRWFDATGTPAPADFQINAYTTGAQRDVRVAADPSGGFVAVWDSLGQDGDAYGIIARRIDAQGAAQGADSVVNSFTTGSSSRPQVAALGEGGFAVTWTNFSDGLSFTSPRGGGPTQIVATGIDANLTPVSQDVLVSPAGSTSNGGPIVADVAGNGFVVVWTEFIQSSTDLSGRIIINTASQLCGDANVSDTVTASDALIALQTAVGSATCDPCLCDVNSAGGVTATDALLVLQAGVGQPVTLTCAACAT